MFMHSHIKNFEIVFLNKRHSTHYKHLMRMDSCSIIYSRAILLFFIFFWDFHFSCLSLRTLILFEYHFNDLIRFLFQMEIWSIFHVQHLYLFRFVKDRVECLGWKTIKFKWKSWRRTFVAFLIVAWLAHFDQK